MCYPNHSHPNSEDDVNIAVLNARSHTAKLAVVKAYKMAWEACSNRDLSPLSACNPHSANNSKLYCAKVKMGLFGTVNGLAVAATYYDNGINKFCFDVLTADVSASSWVVDPIVEPMDRAIAIAP